MLRQHPVFIGTAKNIVIACAAGDLSHVHDIMAGAAKSSDEIRLDAFVREPAHSGGLRLAIDDFLIGKVIGSEGLSGSDVLPSQPRMIGEYRDLS